MLLGKGVGAAFTAIAPKYVGTTLVLWLEFEARQRGLFSLAVRRTALLGKGVGAVFNILIQVTIDMKVGELLCSYRATATMLRSCITTSHPTLHSNGGAHVHNDYNLRCSRACF